VIGPKRALVPTPAHPSLPTLAEISVLKAMGDAIAASHMFNIANGAVALGIFLKARELDLQPIAALDLIQLVQGHLSLSPRGQMAMLIAHPLIDKIELTRLVDKAGGFVGYSCRIVRTSGFEHTATFTMAMAQQAGLIKSGSGWASYPENMCLWRSVGFAADVAASDITSGATALMKMPEQFGVTLSEGGDIIEGNATVIDFGAPAAPVPPTAPTIEELMERFSPEQILAANGGRVPSDEAELVAIAEKLAGGGQ